MRAGDKDDGGSSAARVVARFADTLHGEHIFISAATADEVEDRGGESTSNDRWSVEVNGARVGSDPVEARPGSVVTLTLLGGRDDGVPLACEHFKLEPVEAHSA